MPMYREEGDYGSGGDLLKALDLPENVKMPLKIVSIEKMELPSFADRNVKEMKFVIGFEDKEKKMALNATNIDAIEATLGPQIKGYAEDPDFEKWVGHTVVLYRDKVKIQSTGEIKACMRIEKQVTMEEANPDDIDF